MAKLIANGYEIARLERLETAEIGTGAPDWRYALSVRSNGRVLERRQMRDTIGTARKWRPGAWRVCVNFKNGAVLLRWIDAKLKKGWNLETAAGAPGLVYLQAAEYRTLVFNKKIGAFESRPAAEIERLIAENKLAAAGGEPERKMRAPAPIEKGENGRGPTPRAFGDGRFPKPTEPEPTVEQLMQWEFDGVYEATDGCRVEPDGKCAHGHVSWARYLGVI